MGALVETGMVRDTQVRLLRKQMTNGMKRGLLGIYGVSSGQHIYNRAAEGPFP